MQGRQAFLTNSSSSLWRPGHNRAHLDPEVPLTEIEKTNNETETDDEGYLNPFLRIEFEKLFLHKCLFIWMVYIKLLTLLLQPRFTPAAEATAFGRGAPP